jgi:hypothetical protein
MYMLVAFGKIFATIVPLFLKTAQLLQPRQLLESTHTSPSVLHLC